MANSTTNDEETDVIETEDTIVPAPDSPTLGPLAPQYPAREGDLVEVRNDVGILAFGAVSYIDKNGVATVDYVGKSRFAASGSMFDPPPKNAVRVHVRYLKVMEGPDAAG